MCGKFCNKILDFSESYFHLYIIKVFIFIFIKNISKKASKNTFSFIYQFFKFKYFQISKI